MPDPDFALTPINWILDDVMKYQSGEHAINESNRRIKGQKFRNEIEIDDGTYTEYARDDIYTEYAYDQYATSIKTGTVTGYLTTIYSDAISISDTVWLILYDMN